MKEKILFTIIGIMTTLCSIKAQVPLNPDPYWSYVDTQVRYVTFADINNDGYPELAVAIEGDYNYLFMNNGGIMESTPSWQSSDADLSIAIAFGDYDNDGDLDMAVSNYQIGGGRTKLYENMAGTITAGPVWTAGSGYGGIWCDWGDVDNDGDLDLAIVDLFAYPAVFYNDSGSLETTPSWIATDYNIDEFADWADINGDGYLDLVVGNINAGQPSLRVYYNSGGILENNASWTSSVPTDQYPSAAVCAGDIDKDGWIDIANAEGVLAAHNLVYRNLGGTLEDSASWYSANIDTF